MTAGPRLTLSLHMAPFWGSADACREALERLLPFVVSPPDLVEPLAMAASELVENAVKYGTPDGATASVAVEVVADAEGVTIDVASPCAADSAHFRRLVATVQRLGSPEAAREAYVERLRTVAEAADDASRLGLPRIVCEANARLAAARGPDGRVHVRATWRR